MAFISNKRRSNLFDPGSVSPFKISRSKIDLFRECPRCFFLDRRLGVSRPSLPGFTLNIAVDELLKKEFDIYRRKKTSHPIMEEYGIRAVPFDHPRMNTWRTNFTGVQVHHTPTNFLVFGAVDDVWEDKNGKLIVVDYKATSKRSEINMDEGWGPQYKRQLEVYQWLLRGNGFDVSPTGYFVYCNGDKDQDAFNKKLEFKIEVIAHEGDDSWVEPKLKEIKACLMADLPNPGQTCEYCVYRGEASSFEINEPKQRGLF